MVKLEDTKKLAALWAESYAIKKDMDFILRALVHLCRQIPYKELSDEILIKNLQERVDHKCESHGTYDDADNHYCYFCGRVVENG